MAENRTRLRVEALTAINFALRLTNTDLLLWSL
jgi:hypothetical protein